MKILRIPLVIVLVVLAGRTFHANAQTVTILHSFGNSPDGAYPEAGLVQGSDSNFYGTVNGGGTSTNCPPYGCGTVFKLTPTGTLTTLYNFTNGVGGYLPGAGLVQGTDGNFYGTTDFGGTFFRISPNGTYSNLYTFGSSSNDGQYANALVQGNDGDFYGTIYTGGTSTNCGGYGCGYVFRMSPGGAETILYSFGGAPNDGAKPSAGMVQGSDGNFYGTTCGGGTSTNYDSNCTCVGYGTVFRISPNGTYSNLYSFGSSSNDGEKPCALVQGSDGNFYGTTTYGGAYGNGTVFRISASGSYTSLYSFGSSPNDGIIPFAGLVQGSDGNFYGTTSNGGTTNEGTVFRISLSIGYASLYSFGSSPNDGVWPMSVLVQGSGGYFYGTTAYGGTSTNCGSPGCGTVFKLDVGLGSISTNCTYALAATTAHFGAAGGSCNAGVTAANGCAWTASTTNGWITITSGSSGSGTGTVAYTVAASTSATSRSGTMTIAGQTFTVNQLGATPVTYSFSTPVQTLKTKLNKKTGVTITNCTITVSLVVQNTGTTGTAKFSVQLWLDQGCAFNPSVGLAPLTEKVKILTAGKSVKIKIKTKKLTGDLAGTFIVATDADHNVLATVEVPSP